MSSTAKHKNSSPFPNTYKYLPEVPNSSHQQHLAWLQRVQKEKDGFNNSLIKSYKYGLIDGQSYMVNKSRENSIDSSKSKDLMQKLKNIGSLNQSVDLSDKKKINLLQIDPSMESYLLTSLNYENSNKNSRITVEDQETNYYQNHRYKHSLQDKTLTTLQPYNNQQTKITSIPPYSLQFQIQQDQTVDQGQKISNERKQKQNQNKPVKPNKQDLRKTSIIKLCFPDQKIFFICFFVNIKFCIKFNIQQFLH